jgi:hypothetical protein
MKGQSAIEFLSLVSMSALLLAAMYGLIAAKQNQLAERQEFEESEQVAEKVSFQIEMALIQGEGYSRVFNIRETIQGSEYNVTVGGGDTVVRYVDNTVVEPARYQGSDIKISTSDSQVFKVLNNGSVYIIPQ